MSKRTTAALARLVFANSRKRVRLKVAQARPEIDEARGVAAYDVATGEYNLHVLVPPLTEKSRTTTTVTIPVPSGATEYDTEVITSLVMTDAEGFEYTFNFTPPV